MFRVHKKEELDKPDLISRIKEEINSMAGRYDYESFDIETKKRKKTIDEEFEINDESSFKY